MEMRQYDLAYSLQRFLAGETGIVSDIVYDGYTLDKSKPFITIEQMQNNTEILVKQREAVQVIYRFQIGLHASNPVEKMREQERISELLTFKEMPYYSTEKSVDQPVGYFLCDLKAVVPMPAGEQSRQSEYHRVYFDIEIENIKRGC